MDKFIGTITYELRAKDSKSEGYASFLTLSTAQRPKGEQANHEDDNTPIQTIYQLYRSGVYAINDTFFEPYNELLAEVEGVIMMEKWIDVKSIKLVEIE